MKEDIYQAIFGKDRALSMALGYRDMMTLLHSERVNELSTIIGLNCNLSFNELSTLRLASTFHDIGKIGISDTILDKPMRLNAEEWEAIKKHSQIGEHIMLCSEIPGHPITEAARAIRHHHEHFNGGGYPDGLSGNSIPLLSRIIAIADSYDAMATTRAYHKPRRHGEIMDIMHSETGSKFEPGLMHIFSEQIENSPMKVE